MPHYADGTEAKVGDQVTGKLYNSGPDLKAGTIVSITPGAESCNAKVQFTEVTPGPSADAIPGKPNMAIAVTVSLGANHGSSGPVVAIWTCEDYCATSELTKISPIPAPPATQPEPVASVVPPAAAAPPVDPNVPVTWDEDAANAKPTAT